MMKNIFSGFCLAVGAVMLSSCVSTYTLVTDPRGVAVADFTVDLPRGWRQNSGAPDPFLRPILEKRHKLSWDVIRLTRDGFLLQQICIGRIAVAEELPNTKKKFAPDMIPLEAAEIIVDEFRSNTNLTNQEIMENIPASVGGRPGFKLHYTYRAEQRLKMEGLFYAALAGPWLYYVIYEAPAQHYFNKDLEQFEQTRASFQIGKTPS